MRTTVAIVLCAFFATLAAYSSGASDEQPFFPDPEPHADPEPRTLPAAMDGRGFSAPNDVGNAELLSFLGSR